MHLCKHILSVPSATAICLIEREENISRSLTLPILIETPINSSVFIVRHGVILGLATHTLLRWCCYRCSKTHTPFTSWHDHQSIHRHLTTVLVDCLQSDRLQKRHRADNFAWHILSSLIETGQLKKITYYKFFILLNAGNTAHFASWRFVLSTASATLTSGQSVSDKRSNRATEHFEHERMFLSSRVPLLMHSRTCHHNNNTKCGNSAASCIGRSVSRLDLRLNQLIADNIGFRSVHYVTNNFFFLKKISNCIHAENYQW